MDDEDLDAVADRLYALVPEDFTAARDAAAKQAGGKEQRAAVKALRRPSVSAWVVNLLAREQAALLQQLLALGPALAEAQRAGQGDELRALGAQRRELVGAVTSTAVASADRPVSAQVRSEVEQTLEAALADPLAADAVRSGRLVRPLSYAGFGDVDLDDAVAVQRRTPAEQVEPAEPPPDVTALERASLDAAAALDDAVTACEEAERRRTRAQEEQDDARAAAARARDELQRLEERVAAAQQDDERARRACSAADTAAEQADTEADRRRRRVADAQAAAEQARAELDRARRDR